MTARGGLTGVSGLMDTSLRCDVAWAQVGGCGLGCYVNCFLFFFFQAEDGIRDYKVTGVQTCALPISRRGQGHGAGDAQIQGPGGWQGGEPDRAGRAVGRMSAPPARGVASAVLETLDRKSVV